METVIEQTVFQKRLEEAKKEPRSRVEAHFMIPAGPGFPDPPYVVRGIPKDALNYKLDIRMDECLFIHVLQPNRRAFTAYACSNEHGEIFMTDRILQSNG